MIDETRSYPDAGGGVEEAILAFLESQERGEEPDASAGGPHHPPASAALDELREDQRELEPWFRPLRAVTQATGGGRPFGNYELLEVVAVGGQGVVYRARQVHTNKVVALKLINPGDRHRSLRELEMAADLEHEHLVRVYHVGEQDGRLYFTMKLAEKGSLAKNFDEYRLPSEPAATAALRAKVEGRKKQVACFLAKLARAVHYLHERGVVHRDLKPGNVLLDARGEPLLTDFGLARRVGDNRAESSTPGPAGPAEDDSERTPPGAVLGTMGYLAPEQARGQTGLTPAVDVYALGAILYKLLTGRTPFVGTTEEIIAQTADRERLAPWPSLYNPNVGTGSDLELICKKCLAKAPDRRYASAADLADDLERYARDEPISIRRMGPLERWTRRVVGAINHRVPIFGMARWGAIDLWDAVLNLAVNGALYVLIRTDQPPALLWLALLTWAALWWWMFLTYLFRQETIAPAERNLALLWGGVFLAGLTLAWVYCPPFGSARAADLLALYPPWTVVNGVAFLVVGRLFWGRYYFVGLAHFLVAILMPLRLDLAPLVYGVFVAVCMAAGAWDHYRTARSGSPS
jgi:serine/threonine-protein kinase